MQLHLFCMLHLVLNNFVSTMQMNIYSIISINTYLSMNKKNTVKKELNGVI